MTDKGVRFLNKFPALTEVNLRSTKITDQSIEALSKMKRFRKIWLGGTKVTKSRVAQLRKALPNCLISVEISDQREFSKQLLRKQNGR